MKNYHNTKPNINNNTYKHITVEQHIKHNAANQTRNHTNNNNGQQPKTQQHMFNTHEHILKSETHIQNYKQKHKLVIMCWRKKANQT